MHLRYLALTRHVEDHYALLEMPLQFNEKLRVTRYNEDDLQLSVISRANVRRN